MNPTHMNRRWLLSLDPILEGGSTGEHAKRWDVEDKLVTVALFGDVTIGLSETRSATAAVSINAYGIFRDVDVFVAENTRVALYGSVVRGDPRNEVPAPPDTLDSRVVQIHGHALLGDVTVCVAETSN